MSMCIRLVYFFLVGVVFLSVPALVIAYGGGGGDGGGDSGTAETPGMIFFEPNENEEFETNDGVPVLTNLPEPGQPFVTLIEKELTPEEQQALVEIAQEEIEFWDTMISIAETADKVGKNVGWGLAFTPLGVPAKTALSAARGAADSPESAAAAGLTEVFTSKFPPVVGIVIGEIVGTAVQNGVTNNAPMPHVGDPGVAPPDAPPLITPGGGGPQTDHRSVFVQ